MPTKKPRVQTILDENEYKKFKILCKIKDRTESKLAGIIIKKYIEAYEAEHGPIPLPKQEPEATGTPRPGGGG